MERYAVKLYIKYVDMDRLKKWCKRHTNRALASFYSLRYYKNRFKRIKSLGNGETVMENDELPGMDELFSISDSQQCNKNKNDDVGDIKQQTSDSVESESSSSDQQLEYSKNLKCILSFDNGK